jgi:hypothetical protein
MSEGLGTLVKGAVLGFSFRSRFDARGLVWVNRISGTIILVFGVLALASLLTPAPENA